MGIITSLLDNDLYKLPMWQTMFHRHPEAEAEYEFICRNVPAIPLATLATLVGGQLMSLENLRFTDVELNYLRTSPHLRFLKSDFIDFLAVFHFQNKFITVGTDGDRLVIRAKGPQVHVMFYEIFVLSIVSELYYKKLIPDGFPVAAQTRLNEKIALLKEQRFGEIKHPFVFFDFGCRRRLSRDWHESVVEQLAREVPQYFKGTSDIFLAMKYNLVPIGTMAHEYLQSYQASGVRLRDFQRQALEDWVHEFRGDLGVALTDVIGIDAFLADFDLYFAKLFDGLRHDSGDPIEWGEKVLDHYAKLKIDPNTKRLVFSDGLNLEKCFELHRHFGNRVMVGFGIGTNLTNDSILEPLNIVMKLVMMNGQPVAKLPDSEGKTICKDEVYLAYLRQIRDQIISEKSYVGRK